VLGRFVTSYHFRYEMTYGVYDLLVLKSQLFTGVMRPWVKLTMSQGQGQLSTVLETRASLPQETDPN